MNAINGKMKDAETDENEAESSPRRLRREVRTFGPSRRTTNAPAGDAATAGSSGELAYVARPQYPAPAAATESYLNPTRRTYDALLMTYSDMYRVSRDKIAPGLVQLHAPKWLWLTGLLAVCLELFGTWTLIQAGASAVLAIGLVLADAIFIALGHRFVAREATAENRVFAALTIQDRQAAEVERIQARNRRRLWHMPLFVIALAKVTGLLGAAQTSPEVFLVAIAYLALAFLHIFFTGYLVAGILARRRWARDRQLWAQGKGAIGVQAERLETVENAAGIRNAVTRVDREVASGPHEIRVENLPLNADGLLHIRVVTRGMLDDQQISQLLALQETDAARAAVAPALVRAQLNIIELALSAT